MAEKSEEHHPQASIFWHTTQSVVTVVNEQFVTVWVNGYAEPHKLLSAYRTYKENCIYQVDAASSYILYDAQANVLIAARDLFGIYPLYYAQEGGALLVGFSVKDIVESGRIPLAINRQAVAEYMHWGSGNDLITNQTVYKNIYSLLPAHSVLFNAGQLSSVPYCQLELSAGTSLDSEVCIQRFNTCFIRSVQTAINPFDQVATHISGGLDSSSVCSVAQSLASKPVHSFFIQTNTATTREEPYVDAVIDKWQQKGKPIVHQYVAPDETIYRDTKQYTDITGLPNRLLLPVSTFLPVLRQAQEHGCGVLLSGHGGDQITGYGFEYLDVLFENKDWVKLKTALDQYADSRVLESLAGSVPFQTIAEKRQAYTLQYCIGKIKQTKGLANRAVLSLVLLTHFGIKASHLRRFISRRTKRETERPVPTMPNLLRNEWLSQQKDVAYQVIDVRQLVAQEPSEAQKEQINFVYGRLGIHYNEDMAQLQAQYGLKTAHPFLDKHLLEISLHTPLPLRFANGLGRGLLRQALGDYLPKKVAMRLDKGEFSAYTQHAFRQLYDEFMDQTDEQHPVWRIVHKSAFDALIALIFDERYTIRQRNRYRFTASRVIYLAIWLEYFETISA